MSFSLRLRAAMFLAILQILSLLTALTHATPISSPQPLSGVPNHPISGISDFHPSSTAPLSSGDVNETLAICLAIKNEYHDVTEWLVHHYNHHNIRRFYLMDDGSSPPMSSYDYSPFVPPEVITHRYMDPSIRAKEGQQHRIYERCMAEFGGRHTWMGFIDTDEFLEVKAPDTLHGILREFEGNDTVGALGVNWLNHNSAGLAERAAGKSVRQSFTRCVSDGAIIDAGGNTLIKPFAKTSAWKMVGSVHRPILTEGMQTVGEHGDVVTGWMHRSPVTRDRVVLHHYAVKSRSEYEVKLNRGDVMFEGMLRGERYWGEVNGAESFECKELARYEP